jgi:hypothetical protein
MIDLGLDGLEKGEQVAELGWRKLAIEVVRHQ